MDSYKLFDFGLLYLDWPTSIYTLVMFCIAMISLNKLLFQPIIRTLEKRASDTANRNKSAEDKKAEIDRLQLQIKANLSDNQKQIHEERTKQMQTVLEHVKGTLDEKKGAIEKRTKQTESELQTEIDQAYKHAKDEINNVSRSINSKIISQS